MLKVAVICGGQSAEHDISLMSAKNVINALDDGRYQIQVIYIGREGEWFLLPDWPEHTNGQRLNPRFGGKDGCWLTESGDVYDSDVIFPLIHGECGEDGDLQGLLTLLGRPYVGSKVLGSALAMDKIATKQVLLSEGFNLPRYYYSNRQDIAQLDRQLLFDRLGSPLFVKPANTGSSLFISRVSNLEQLDKAIDEALAYDHRVVFEENIPGREIECAVLEVDGELQASVAGEVIPQNGHDFYDYNAKYFDENGAKLVMPADLEKEVLAEVQALSIKAFKALDCHGMARVDLRIRTDDIIFINELNTIPGFTKISMYPQLWGVSGITYSKLMDILIDNALNSGL